MASLKKRGNVWHVVYYDTKLGNNRSRSLKTDDERKARELLESLQDKLEKVEAGKLGVRAPTARTFRIHSLLQDYQKHRMATGKRQAGVDYVRKHVRNLTAMLENVPVDELTDEHLMAYVDARKRHPSRGVVPRNQTLQKEIDTIKAAYNWAIKREAHRPEDQRRVSRIPFIWTDLPEEPTPPNVATNWETMASDFKAMMSWARENNHWSLYHTLALSGYMGMRTGGIVSLLDWNGIDLKAGTLTFVQTKKKSAVRRTVSVKDHPQLMKVLEEAQSRDPVHFPVTADVKVLYRAQEKALGRKASGLVYNWTSFRHLFVYWCKQSGLKEWDVVAIMGHTESRLIKQVYGRWGDVEAGNALAKLKIGG